MRGVNVKTSGQTKVPGVGFAGNMGAARAGVGGNQSDAMLRGIALGAGLGHKGLFVAGQACQIHECGYRALLRVSGQKHREAHWQSNRAGCMLVEALHAAKAGVFADQFKRRVGHGAMDSVAAYAYSTGA